MEKICTDCGIGTEKKSVGSQTKYHCWGSQCGVQRIKVGDQNQREELSTTEHYLKHKWGIRNLWGTE
jgi:hypothetical protein